MDASGAGQVLQLAVAEVLHAAQQARAQEHAVPAAAAAAEERPQDAAELGEQAELQADEIFVSTLRELLTQWLDEPHSGGPAAQWLRRSRRERLLAEALIP
jgi:hypothetical protein